MEKIQEDEKTSFKVVNRSYQTIRGRELEDSIKSDSLKGITHEFVTVYEEPTEFQFGVIYVLYGGKRAWTYIEAPHN